MDKNELVKSMIDVRYEPFVNKQEMKDYHVLDTSDIIHLGAGFQILQPVMDSLKQSEGLYKVIMPEGYHLSQDTNGYYLGGMFDQGNHLKGQARWQPVEGAQALTPQIISAGVVSVMIIAVEKELSDIKDMQKQILSYMEEKDIAELVTNTFNLQDIQKDYKYNLDNEKFITVSLNQVQNIKHHSKKMMEFYKQRIMKLLQNNDLFHISPNAKSLVDKVCKELRNEGIAYFNYVYSLYLQVMLLGNFDESYIRNVIDDIHHYKKEYDCLYNDIHKYIDKYTKNSIDHQMLNGLADVHKMAGDVIHNIPVIGDTPIQDIIKGTGKNIKLFNKKEYQNIRKSLIQYKDASVDPFVKSLKEVSSLYNKPLTLLVSGDQLCYKGQ